MSQLIFIRHEYDVWPLNAINNFLSRAMKQRRRAAREERSIMWACFVLFTPSSYSYSSSAYSSSSCNFFSFFYLLRFKCPCRLYFMLKTCQELLLVVSILPISLLPFSVFSFFLSFFNEEKMQIQLLACDFFFGPDHFKAIIIEK